MNKMFEDLIKIKLKLIDNCTVIIENFSNIHEVHDKTLLVDNYLITGDSLSIVMLDKYKIIVEGKIEEIKIV